MAMAPTFDRLRAMTDDELRDAYDAASRATQVGTAFYLDELSRRAFHRASAAALEEARQARRLALFNMLVAIVATAVAVVAILV